jgi:hypothetical protein
MKTLQAIMIASALAFGGFAGSARASDKVPQTAAEHEEAAKEYANKAKGHRAEANMHRGMAEMYKTQIKGPSNRKPNPWLINMVKHCNLLATNLDTVATEEEKAAETLSKQAKATPETTAKTN